MRSITLKTATVGQSFGTCAVLQDADTGAVIACTQTRPFGFTAAAMIDGYKLAQAMRRPVVTEE